MIPSRRSSCALPEAGEEIAHPVVEADLVVFVVHDGSAGLRRQVADTVGHSLVGATSMPPLLVVMILLPLKENTPMSPSVPAGRPRYVAPSASAASSTIGDAVALAQRPHAS